LLLPNIGKRIAEKIQEILDTGHLRKNDQEPESVKILKEFLKVYGVGPKLAQQFYQEGMRSLDDLRKRDDLTHAQKIGLQYADELQERIPRHEVASITEIVKRDLYELDPDLIAETLGSYRRGAETCGDIDVLVYSKTDKTTLGLMEKIVHKLKKSIITDVIASSGTTFRGICRLGSNPHRRLDILITPKSEVGAAQLYFTGNDVFNRSIRLLAEKKGMILNQHGLYLLDTKKKVAGATEKDILEALGVPYRPPEERNT
jgi:DNA polymerase/3'-5' exonuclease PolX